MALAVALVFSNTYSNGYHLDDVYRVETNPELQRVLPLGRHFVDPRTSTSLPQLEQFRPLLPLTLSLDVAAARVLGIERLTAHHAGNALLHLASVALAYLLFRELLARGLRPAWPSDRCARAAFAGALLFAVHPVSGIPINYVCARDLLLMQGFLLGALLVYARMRASGDSLGGWAATLGLLALSILGKTNAAVAPALVLAFELLFGAGARARGTWLRPLVAAAVPVLFVAWTSFGLGFSDLDQLDPEDANPWLYGLTELRAHLFHYARNAVWPFRMRLLPDVGLVDGASDPGVWLGLAFVLASLAVAWRLRERAPAASFAILAYWILFALTSSVIPLRQKVADYRQYPSLAFLGLLAGWWIWRALPERAARAALAALTLYFGASTFALSRSWSDGESLWSRSVRYGGTAQAHLNYGRSVVDRDPVLAESHYREALRRDPDNVFALTNLGILLVHTGHTDAGLAELFAAVDLRPRDAQMRHWYAEGLARAGRAGDALAQRVLAAAFDPRQPDYADRADRARAAADGRALYDAARALQLGGETALSLPLLERLHRTGPGHADSLFLEGWARQSAGERAAAIELYERQLAEQPDHVQARLNLALARLESGEPEAARAHFERVLELDPTRGEAHFHLARCLELLGDTEGAARERALWAAGR